MNRLIYIVEDDTAIKELESYALINSEFSVEGFERGKELFDALTIKIPALILLDIMLPDEDGIHILKKIRSTMAYRDIPIIMVTAKTTEIDAVKGLDMGADDYITKPFGVMELISRVKAVLRRTQKAEHQQILIYKNIVIDEAQHKVFVDDEEIELTYKEYEVLKLLIINKGIVLTRDRIMESIWGYDFEQGNRTVDVHIQSLRKKIKSAGVHIKTIRNVGYKVGD
ncbi:response regulator transcription factor [Eubacterium sp.]|uniref:response regulator transcription factor n=1 Tax=Eubacterium sp. TaxID=142586 RepID=UPI0025BFC3A2|nr:response regulator transcription factor [Eubacterium sp.]MCI7800595.1 response regulator transcription factor [Eubacterium sp.]MDD7332012.1 response regulator transcription factor [Eubacterium sp.]